MIEILGTGMKLCVSGKKRIISSPSLVSLPIAEQTRKRLLDSDHAFQGQKRPPSRYGEGVPAVARNGCTE
jgi:hypothetical protein